MKTLRKIAEKYVLFEMSVGSAIMRMRAVTNLLDDKDNQNAIKEIKIYWKKLKKSEGKVSSLQDLIKGEFLFFPRVREMYDKLSDISKQDFWNRVKWIENILKEE